MYLWGEELFAAMTKRRRDYVAFSHAGHGVNSYAITYELVLKGLVVFIQVAWGGVYMSNELQSQKLSDRFDRCRQFLAHAEGITLRSKRLLVADSEMLRVGIAGWVPGGLGEREARQWLRNHETERDPFDNADELLAEARH
jgi:hypothetical protein